MINVLSCFSKIAKKMIPIMEQTTIIHVEISTAEDLPKNFHRNYHTHLYCHRGRIQFLFNDEKMECKAGEFLFWFAERRLSGLQFSANCKATVLLVEKSFLTDNVPDQS